MRPFSTLGLKPYLWVDHQGVLALSRAYLEASRRYHPDLFINASKEEQETAEATSSQLNADIRLLKNPLDLARSVIDQARVVVDGKSSAATAMEFSAEYFEIQESLADDGFTRALTERIQRLMQKLEAENAVIQSSIEEELKRFPFSGFGTGPEPWARRDLEVIAEKLSQFKFRHRCLEDLSRTLLQGRDNAHTD